MKNLVIANWKMNPNTPQEARRLFDSVRKEIRGVKNSETVFCPPFVYLLSLKISKSLSRAKSRDRNACPERSRRISLGAQDCFWQESGAYTGEISPAMLKNLGCRYVICGHSERR
ncbi:MAG: triose-phosphate isomerase, partial [bacterium]|nr:triose-phosphate isomerase [bacterium]